jgi:hypothetical protein
MILNLIKILELNIIHSKYILNENSICGDQGKYKTFWKVL